MTELEECRERQEAELEFVSAAYAADEAWTETNENSRKIPVRVVYRILRHEGVWLRLSLSMPMLYPLVEPLIISSTVDMDQTDKRWSKVAYSISSALSESCKIVANESLGEEGVLIVLGHADEWLQDNMGAIIEDEMRDAISIAPTGSEAVVFPTKKILGRRLIYSHHIISKTKRSDIKHLASDYSLTGYMKIGWPGLLIIEGEEDNCIAFYDEIRGWAWQYLVVRGEMQEPMESQEILDSKRCFEQFLEVDDMSTVAKHCRQVGLETLFKTSMKVYTLEEVEVQTSDAFLPHGALVLVDHMNDKKAYRKWIRRTCRELDVFVLIKEVFARDDFSKRPKIFVGLVGDKEKVAMVLKKWKISRVDVDSKGKPCLERKMRTLSNCCLERAPASRVDWVEASSENVNISKCLFLQLLAKIGGSEWSNEAARQWKEI